MNHFTVSPAYGRDYKSQTAALKDWNDGKDFQHQTRLFTGGGTYISKRDIPAGAEVHIRFDKLQEVVVVRT